VLVLVSWTCPQLPGLGECRTYRYWCPRRCIVKRAGENHRLGVAALGLERAIDDQILSAKT